MSYYVLVNPKIEYFRKALFSYQLAEKHLTVKFADLIYNKGTLYFYLQDYMQAMEEFQKADELDQTLHANMKVEECLNIVHRIKKDYYDRFFNKNMLKDTCKELLKYISMREVSLQNAISKFKTQEGKSSTWTMKQLSGVKQKANEKVFIIVKFIKWVMLDNLICKMVLVMDSQEQFMILSVFNPPGNISSKLVPKITILGIIDPWVKMVKTDETGEQEYIPFLQLFDYNDLIIDNSKLKK